MRRGPIPDEHDGVPREGKVVTTTTKPPPILLDELIAQILLRIPVSSLVRLRNSICSSWKTLISSSQFAKDHLRRSMAVDPALTHPRIAYSSQTDLNPTIEVFSVRSVMEKPPHEPTKVVPYEGRRFRFIIGSCNGLLCLHDEERAMLWNPCTGFNSQPLEIGGVLSICGFGYDHVNDKYKLFALVKKKSGESVPRMFTFGLNSTWRTIQDSPPELRDRNCKCSVLDLAGLFVSGTGTLNWLCHRYLNLVWVVSLDLVKETYSEFSLPSKHLDDDNWVTPQLGILRDCLAVCYENKTHWTLWLMKDYGVPQSWTKLTIIPHLPLLVYGRSDVALRPIYMLKDVLLAFAPSGMLVLCNLKDGSIDFPNIDSSSASMPGLCPFSRHSSARIFHLYHESLVSPSHFGLPVCSSEMRLTKPSGAYNLLKTVSYTLS